MAAAWRAAPPPTKATKAKRVQLNIDDEASSSSSTAIILAFKCASPALLHSTPTRAFAQAHHLEALRSTT